LTVLDMVAITPEAHAALWYTVLSVDLVGPIRSDVALAIDDTLPYLLTDPRVLRTTGLNDMMWLHLRDVAHALRARTYGSDDELVIDVDLGDRTERWKVSGSPAGAEVRRTRRRPDLTMNRASLGAIYLGGVRPSTLVRAGLVTVARPDVARRADIFFATDRQPHCTTGF
jgi:predicted acetyltransferase